MIPYKTLIPLQELDLQISQKMTLIDEKKLKVARNVKDVDANAQLIEKKQALLKKIQLRLREAESDLRSKQESLELTELKLKSPGLPPTAYTALEKEIKRLKKTISEIESKVLEDMGKVETLETDVPKGQKIVVGRKLHLEQIKQRVSEEIIEIRREISNLDTQRSQIALKIETELLEMYEELRRKKKGQVLFACDTPSCPACGMAMPASLANSIASHEDAETCSNCDLLIYWTGLRD